MLYTTCGSSPGNASGTPRSSKRTRAEGSAPGSIAAANGSNPPASRFSSTGAGAPVPSARSTAYVAGTRRCAATWTGDSHDTSAISSQGRSTAAGRSRPVRLAATPAGTSTGSAGTSRWKPVKSPSSTSSPTKGMSASTTLWVTVTMNSAIPGPPPRHHAEVIWRNNAPIQRGAEAERERRRGVPSVWVNRKFVNAASR